MDNDRYRDKGGHREERRQRQGQGTGTKTVQVLWDPNIKALKRRGFINHGSTLRVLG